MFNLILNENMKIYRRVSTWMMIVLLLAAVLGFSFLIKNQMERENEADWKSRIAASTEGLKKALAAEPNLPKQSRDRMEKMIAINEYRLENDIPPATPKSVWGFMDFSSNLVSLITLFTIILAGGIVASEFTWGTIKLLLIRPVSRAKILLSKYLSTLLFSLFLLFLLFLSSFLVGILFFGTGGLSVPYLAYWNGKVVEVNMALHVLSLYGLSSVDLLMMSTFAFMISTIFRNNSLAIGLSIFLMFTGSTIVAALSRYGWVKYILFANTDLRQYFDGTPLVEGMTLSFSITVLLAYFLIFHLLSWILFMKRDVAA
ncbi:ABC transporter permease [Thermicanus aegyptius]|uniref:ABC transporter permease n=1 Tax=Thermicanus aegyptius TaxID=94009 RepID=UPI0003FD20E0|nr:ABC transporter permease [Thermicanus aegyptius]